MYDSYGDSWNGATYSIDDAAGHNISSGGLTDYTNYGTGSFLGSVASPPTILITLRLTQPVGRPRSLGGYSGWR